MNSPGPVLQDLHPLGLVGSQRYQRSGQGVAQTSQSDREPRKVGCYLIPTLLLTGSEPCGVWAGHFLGFWFLFFFFFPSVK